MQAKALKGELRYFDLLLTMNRTTLWEKEFALTRDYVALLSTMGGLYVYRQASTLPAPEA